MYPVCFLKNPPHRQGGRQMSFVRFENVSKEYGSGEVRVKALQQVSFEIEKGEICIVLGQSGAGKTTLLNLLGGMDTLTEGHIYLDGRDISGYGDRELAGYRRRDIGFVFQFYNLIPNLTALENVEIACQLVEDAADCEEMLRLVGLGDRMGNFPAQLSGGEQQRVAIARAMAKNPKLLLCDEPTGALDYETGKSILRLIQNSVRRDGRTAVIITHNQALAPMADRVIRIRSGMIDSVNVNSRPESIDNIEW